MNRSSLVLKLACTEGQRACHPRTPVGPVDAARLPSVLGCRQCCTACALLGPSKMVKDRLRRWSKTADGTRAPRGPPVLGVEIESSRILGGGRIARHRPSQALGCRRTLQDAVCA